MQSIRLASPTDAAAISTLVLSLAPDSMAEPQGEEAQRFYAAMSPIEVEKYVSQEHRCYAVAEVDGEIQGMILVLNNNYVGQFFVHPAHQGRGIGSSLWRFALACAKERGGTGEFTVNSSLAAVAIYERFGFEQTGSLVVQHGFKFVSMRRAAKSAA